MNYSNELQCFPAKEKKTILVSLAPILNKLISIHVQTPYPPKMRILNQFELMLNYLSNCTNMGFQCCICMIQ